MLIVIPAIRKTERVCHPAKNRVSRYAGMQGEVLADVCCKKLRDGDRLLLCTDGLTRMLPDAEIKRTYGQQGYSADQKITPKTG